MSLEDAITENTKWLEKVHVELLVMNNLAKDGALTKTAVMTPFTTTVSVLPSQEAVKETKPPKAEKPPKEEKKEVAVAEGPVLSDVQKMITKIVAAAGSSEAKAILAEFKVERASALDAKHYAKFIERCEASLAML